ncbi:hypothetical protein MLD38_038940 [Melastoma candidum]|uniref:Uncharacterized protein n=1 Tax=Melastoma candidum TaxID=119954 RepID=A0ACB9L1Z8_9MYRT|nr:hypothetical protein MLD38_038940 [Melastoma candidum]
MRSGEPEVVEIGVDSSLSFYHHPFPSDHLYVHIPTNPPLLHQHGGGGDVSLLSTPHKRPLPLTTQFHSPRSSSPQPPHPPQKHRHPPFFKPCRNDPPFAVNPRKASSFSCPESLFVAFRLRNLRVRFFGIHLRCLFLLLLPSLYFFASYPRRSLFLELASLVGFSLALLVSLNLALPRFPSIRLLLSRSLSARLASSFSDPKPSKPVLWSIGSRTKAEKKPARDSGCWVEVYSNGDVYEGEFLDGKCSGSGVYYYCKTGRYEGDWVDGKYDGYGVETWARGSRYRGQYRQGLRHGVGVYRFYTGDVYGGEWFNGQCHGFGEHSCEDGSKYVGQFKQGIKHGLGRYHFRNGDTYSGEYFADKMHGFGVYHFGNGHCYEGAWHEGRRQGFGMYSFRNGETQYGHWRNGVLDAPTNVGLPSSAIHSKVLNAAQEARRAAESAHNLGKVEERVNKAIAAANRSANAARVASVKAVQNRIFPRQHHLGIGRPAPISRS